MPNGGGSGKGGKQSAASMLGGFGGPSSSASFLRRNATHPSSRGSNAEEFYPVGPRNESDPPRQRSGRWGNARGKAEALSSSAPLSRSSSRDDIHLPPPVEKKRKPITGSKNGDCSPKKDASRRQRPDDEHPPRATQRASDGRAARPRQRAGTLPKSRSTSASLERKAHRNPSTGPGSTRKQERMLSGVRRGGSLPHLDTVAAGPVPESEVEEEEERLLLKYQETKELVNHHLEQVRELNQELHSMRQQVTDIAKARESRAASRASTAASRASASASGHRQSCSAAGLHTLAGLQSRRGSSVLRSNSEARLDPPSRGSGWRGGSVRSAREGGGARGAERRYEAYREEEADWRAARGLEGFQSRDPSPVRVLRSARGSAGRHSASSQSPQRSRGADAAKGRGPTKPKADDAGDGAGRRGAEGNHEKRKGRKGDGDGGGQWRREEVEAVGGGGEEGGAARKREKAARKAKRRKDSL